ncbi:hypothetical protein E8M01_20355 [Phreatobacter stygius]|uniref:Uncharacterized protein n=1 Tax=Phreatobacter stygius TaxID=1940610 RepID=A0A4D7B5E2_9HYPH|nr:hypothetical protein E8M01_20355 [Phreatobacter stygius]
MGNAFESPFKSALLSDQVTNPNIRVGRCGNPARPIRKRFADGDITMPLDMAWWDWPLDQIKAAMALLCAGDIAALHARWKAAHRGDR